MKICNASGKRGVATQRSMLKFFLHKMRGFFSDMNTKTVCVARERSIPARGSERRTKGHILRKMNHFTHLRKSSNQKHVCAKLYDYIITLIILSPFWYLNILYLFKWCFGPVVPERIFNFCIFAIIFPWKKDVTLHLKKKSNLNFLYANDGLCQVWLKLA